MLFYLFLLFNSLVHSQPDKTDKEITVIGKRESQDIRIYVDIAVVSKNEKKGTSSSLNVLISEFAQNISMLKHRLNYHAAPSPWQGNVTVYDWTNVMHMPGFRKCNYVDAIRCGIQNRHWTLKTVTLVSDKFSVVTVKVYDEKGVQVGNGSRQVFGTIRWKPKWKITKIRSNSMFGAESQDIIEIWPPEMEELPPLITPEIVSQAIIKAYDVRLRACTNKSCQEKF